MSHDHIVAEGRFNIAEPKWTFREYVKASWVPFLMPLWGAVLLLAFPPDRLTNCIATAFFFVMTWQTTRHAMWLEKFTSCVSDAWSEAAKVLCAEAFEAGRQAGRDEATRDDKPWLH